MKTSVKKDGMSVGMIAENEKDRRLLTRLSAKIDKIKGYSISIAYMGHPKNQRVTQLFMPIHNC
jgi:hypothetical protein